MKAWLQSTRALTLAKLFDDERQNEAMSDVQMAELYERLVKGKSNQATGDRVFLRGWNAGLDFAIKQQRLTCDEVVVEDDMPVDQPAREAAE